MTQFSKPGPLVASVSVLLIVAEAYMAVRMPLMAVACAVQALVLGGLCWLTARWAPAASDFPVRGRLLPLQLGLCLALPLAMSFRGDFTASNGAGGVVPHWVALHHTLFAAFGRVMPGDIALGCVNVLDYFGIAAVALMLLGVPWRAMGLGPFNPGSRRIPLTWLAVPVAGLCFALVARSAPPLGVFRNLGGNMLQNGFSEEFLFRGAMLGRFRTLMSNNVALLAQAMLFGLWHLSNDYAMARGDIALTLASALCNHAVMGYAMGFLTLRTGNIAGASLFHGILDTVTG
ncbi:CPBP family intramembrane glutamic endopeptidase [Rhodanobacter sp. DHB23]|uniref:CPBP family intramembrane glutamic endopeptidase n=1 Tax=Rhodanobacter sp. DHB23 TaxID=2775923 RepID=UPI0017830C77|nr:CPBP family intramembrane glutamic endopeptidase [Rhodanobacter sp. DHB23]MBD8874581.1 CPBP family intramembrane metalloprotease [Rhodanobacter sp. DHB23]